MNIRHLIAIDPDWTKPGFTVFVDGKIKMLGTWDIKDVNTDANMLMIALRRQISEIKSVFSDANKWFFAVENAITSKNVIFGKTVGEVKQRGYGLAKCMFMCGIIAGVAREYGFVSFIDPKEWNPTKVKKSKVHADLFLEYPALKEKRLKRGNGITDDTIDSVLIGKAFLLRKKFRG